MKKFLWVVLFSLGASLLLALLSMTFTSFVMWDNYFLLPSDWAGEVRFCFITAVIVIFGMTTSEVFKS